MGAIPIALLVTCEVALGWVRGFNSLLNLKKKKTLTKQWEGGREGGEADQSIL